MVETKSKRKSKTLWFNIVAAISLFIQAEYSYVVPLELQAYVVTAINVGLRKLTNTAI